MKYINLNIKRWETIISDADWFSVDKVETEGYILKIFMSDSINNTYEILLKCQIYNISHEEHLFELWKIKNNIQPKIGNSFEILDSEWIKEYSHIRDNKNDYKHLVIASDDITIQFITDKYPDLKKINAA